MWKLGSAKLAAALPAQRSLAAATLASATKRLPSASASSLLCSTRPYSSTNGSLLFSSSSSFRRLAHPSRASTSFLSAASLPLRHHYSTSSQGKSEKPHSRPSIDTGDNYTLPHPIWDEEYLRAVEITHKEPECLTDRLALWTIRLMRFNFDWMSGYSWGTLTESKYLTRVIFLETVAGVPGMVGAALRHLNSLRRMQRDHGWIHTLLEEAENERMHLLTFLKMKQPGWAFRGVVLLAQGVFWNYYFLSYLVSPKYCHRMVGYLEEEAVKTYTKLLKDLDGGLLPKWTDEPAPEIAKDYWKLAKDAKVRDVFAVIRADEAHHRLVNHEFASMKPSDPNPHPPGF
ncbi:inducible alternative oxidase 2 [Balamuthia mandrillaris]